LSCRETSYSVHVDTLRRAGRATRGAGAGSSEERPGTRAERSCLLWGALALIIYSPLFRFSFLITHVSQPIEQPSGDLRDPVRDRLCASRRHRGGSRRCHVPLCRPGLDPGPSVFSGFDQRHEVPAQGRDDTIRGSFTCGRPLAGEGWFGQFARKQPTGGLSARPALGWNLAWDGSPSFESDRMTQRLACIAYFGCRDAPMPGRYATAAGIHA
jgi:hypothetical protein